MTEKHRAMQARVIPKESSNARKITTLGMQWVLSLFGYSYIEHWKQWSASRENTRLSVFPLSNSTFFPCLTKSRFSVLYVQIASYITLRYKRESFYISYPGIFSTASKIKHLWMASSEHGKIRGCHLIPVLWLSCVTDEVDSYHSFYLLFLVFLKVRLVLIHLQYFCEEIKFKSFLIHT
jgi:hypothetical protein